MTSCLNHLKILAPFHPFLTAQIYTGDGMILWMKKKKWAEKFDLEVITFLETFMDYREFFV